MKVDFNDLATIKPAANDFLRRETRLDALHNNAGIMIPPKGTVRSKDTRLSLASTRSRHFCLRNCSSRYSSIRQPRRLQEVRELSGCLRLLLPTSLRLEVLI